MAIDVTQLREYTGADASITDAMLQGYIDIAHMIVYEDMASCSMTDERRDTIELNIAAHFTSQAQSPGISASMTHIKIGQSEERYAYLSNETFGLQTSRYGQTAIMLDPCGILVGISSPKLKARFEVI